MRCIFFSFFLYWFSPDSFTKSRRGLKPRYPCDIRAIWSGHESCEILVGEGSKARGKQEKQHKLITSNCYIDLSWSQYESRRVIEMCIPFLFRCQGLADIIYLPPTQLKRTKPNR